jgi:hypothetical protein
MGLTSNIKHQRSDENSRATATAKPVISFVAKLNIARRTPAEQRVKANKTRGLKTPDWAMEFLRIFFSVFDGAVEN